MSTPTTGIVERLAMSPKGFYIIVALILLMFGIAGGHLLFIGGLTDLVFGLPLWAWVQLGVVVVIFVIAYTVVQIREAAIKGAA